MGGKTARLMRFLSDSISRSTKACVIGFLFRLTRLSLAHQSPRASVGGIDVEKKKKSPKSEGDPGRGIKSAQSIFFHLIIMLSVAKVHRHTFFPFYFIKHEAQKISHSSNMNCYLPSMWLLSGIVYINKLCIKLMMLKIYIF